MSETCVTCGKEYEALNSHYKYKPSHKPQDWPTCPVCGERYTLLGQNFRFNPDHRPDLTPKQIEVATGLMMGDGTLARQANDPYIVVKMITPDYLHHLDEVFGIFSCGVRHQWTPKEAAEQIQKRGFREGASRENYSDVYSWQSRNHPDLSQFESWYGEDGKEWPEDIDLTPTTLKHWYVGDGHFSNKNSQHYIKIAMSNEWDATDKVDQMFTSAGIPKPDHYAISERDRGGMKCDALFTRGSTGELFDYMGDPLPGFEYKWP